MGKLETSSSVFFFKNVGLLCSDSSVTSSNLRYPTKLFLHCNYLEFFWIGKKFNTIFFFKSFKDIFDSSTLFSHYRTHLINFSTNLRVQSWKDLLQTHLFQYVLFSGKGIQLLRSFNFEKNRSPVVFVIKGHL